jgi:hypothetical protein
MQLHLIEKRRNSSIENVGHVADRVFLLHYEHHRILAQSYMEDDLHLDRPA